MQAVLRLIKWTTEILPQHVHGIDAPVRLNYNNLDFSPKRSTEKSAIRQDASLKYNQSSR